MNRRKKNYTAVDFYEAQQKALNKRSFMITPPESVPVRFELASLSVRIGAQIVDIMISYGSIILLLALSGLSRAFDWETTLAIFALLSFLARIPYYILTELVWNGQTLAKRFLKIRVISVNGRRLEPYQVVARNLLKEAEVFTPIGLVFGIGFSAGPLRWFMIVWLLVVLCVPFFSKNRQRIGDMIAGTCVIIQPKTQLVHDLSNMASQASTKFDFLPAHLEHYGKFELQTLETILRDTSTNYNNVKRQADVVATIVKKIGYAGHIKANDNPVFLLSFYTAQRAYLEGRKLFGDARENKYHKE